jgi:uncharacterized protein
MFDADHTAPLGIGLAADLGGTAPNWRDFLVATASRPRIQYLNIAATWDQVDKVTHHVSHLIDTGFPFVLHPININLVDAELEEVHVIKGIGTLADLCQAKWLATDAGVWMWGSKYLGEFLVPPIFDQVTVRSIAAKLDELRRVFARPFLVENPPVNFVVEEMHVLNFMAGIAREADCGLVLDIGHLMGYQYATGRSLRDMPLSDFPFDRVVEVHLAGLMRRVSGGFETYYDHHGHPIPEVSWTFLTEILPRLTNLRGVTLEQESCRDAIVEDHLRRTHAICRGHSVGAFRAAL